MNGIIIVNKPTGITSFDVVSRIRRLYQIKKVGHTGTLDPDASGVLPLCIGKATKVIEYLMDEDKAYRVGLLLGAATDTQDATGSIILEKPVLVSDEEIETAINSFMGDQEQIPPMYSAVRIKGKRLYELARRGIEVERSPRPITIYKIDILNIERKSDKVHVTFEVECSKGTYVRTLCHDIGQLLGCGGHMNSLIRTRSGPFMLDDSYTLDDLEEIKSKMKLETALISMDKALLKMPSVYISHNNALRLKNGLSVPLGGLTADFIRVYHESGVFLAIGKTIQEDAHLRLRTHKWIGNDSIGL
ncbi:MAG TPA: tRNA pseudouridine(55) synthase TruB [Clostridiaceae bacterium]|nr:tRNA pseudouridine(55) synthase TruB [Clostridiaceae bacterium]